MGKRIIIDGNNLLFRASFVPIPPIMHGERNVAPVLHFLRMILKYTREFKPDRVYLAWDKRLVAEEDRVFFRKELVGVDYKGNRDTEKSAHIFENTDAIDQIARAMGIRTIRPYNLEADDAIAWLAQNTDDEVVIVSSDSDLWQLITPRIRVFDAKKKQIVDVSNFHMVCPVSIEDYTLYKSILGDPSDNIPGVNGYGKKRTLQLVENKALHTLSEEQRAIVHRNLQIIDLKHAITHSPMDFEKFKEQSEQFDTIKFNRKEFVRACAECGIVEFSNASNIATIASLFGKDDENDQLSRLLASFAA